MKFFDERYKKLNEEQRLAVDTTDGPVLVVAGPGSGKTELLSLRAANILKKTDALASAILCLTFTENAAANMRERLIEVVGKEAYKVAFHTFHSFGTEVIAQYPEYFRSGNLRAADEVVNLEILEEIFDGMKFDDPLVGQRDEVGYMHLKETGRRISDLKKGGLKPEEFKRIIEENEKFLREAGPLVAEVMSDRVSKKTMERLPVLIESLEKIGNGSLKEEIVRTLKELSETKQMSEWKKKFCPKKDKNKQSVLRDLERLPKHKAIADVYAKYQEVLKEKGYFDYEDMVLDVVEALEANPAFRFTLQERYQYVMVDEFQDTNGVQMRLLHNLLDNEVNEGRPNILAVGDDDQAIYKFQGANVENMLGFHGGFKDPKVIVLTKNYRSSQEILDTVKRAIEQGEDRLVNRLEGLRKDLIAANKDAENGEIVEKAFPTSTHELDFVGNKIKELIKSGTKPSGIAVITRLHSDLEEAAKVLDALGVPVSYERKKNVLEDGHIKEIVTILRFIDTLVGKDMTVADYLLPEILCFPFWEIERIDIWKLSVESGRKLWLNAMLENSKMKKIAEFLINLSVEAKNITAEEVIDKIINQTNYRKFYFNEEKPRIEFLDSLTTFVQAVRKHRGSIALTVKDILRFVDLCKKHRISVEYQDFFNDQEKAVNLITVHSAKGLEYETVFITSLQEENWIKTRGRVNLPLPTNVPLMPEADNIDDKLRMYYVAMSRAKKNIYLTHHKFNDRGDEMTRLRFLDGEGPEIEKNGDEKEIQRLLETKVELITKLRLSMDEEEMLRMRLKDYKLSVTHLNNFLNIVDEGPESFLEKNLLRFPEMQKPAMVFGSAMHNAIHDFYKAFKKGGKLPGVSVLLESFEQNLIHKRLNKTEHERMLEKGRKTLPEFFEKNKENFSMKDDSEFNFYSQDVVLGNAMLTGKIDKMRRYEHAGEILVADFKTGKSLKDWDGHNEYERIKAYKYRNQLIFYKLLVENSRSFMGKYKVRKGVLEFLEPDFGSLELTISDEDALEMLKLAQIVYDKVKKLDFPDTSKYEKSFIGMLSFVEDLKGGRV